MKIKHENNLNKNNNFIIEINKSSNFKKCRVLTTNLFFFSLSGCTCERPISPGTTDDFFVLGEVFTVDELCDCALYPINK